MAIEPLPEPHAIRCLPSGRFLANAALRHLTGCHPVGAWNSALMRVYHDDVKRLEDAVSRAFKTHTIQTVRIRIKPTAQTLATFMATVHMDRCQECKHHCAVIIFRGAVCE